MKEEKEEDLKEDLKMKAVKEMKVFELENRIKNLETTVSVLKAIIDMYTMKERIRVQSIGNGVIVITQMEK